MYNLRSGEPSIENRARKPTKGLRARLRTHLRELGLVGKFRTDERRRTDGITTPSLVVIGNVEPIITEFEGLPIKWYKV